MLSDFGIGIDADALIPWDDEHESRSVSRIKKIQRNINWFILWIEYLRI